jgi:hypothetical protein
MNEESRAKAGQLRAFLLGALRRPDADPELDAILRIWSSVQVVVARQRRNLVNLLDGDTCPPAQLPGLGGIVGIDRGTRMAFHMTVRRWRRMIRHAMRIWRNKGLPEGEETVAVAVTGRPALVAGWHDRKAVLDVSSQPYMGLSAPPAFDALGVIDIRAADPSDDASMRAFLAAALADVRMPKRAYRIAWQRLVETWAQGPWQWTQIGGAALMSVDREARTLTVSPGAAIVHMVELARPSVRTRVQVPVGAVLQITLHHQGDGSAGAALEVECLSEGFAQISVLDHDGTVLDTATVEWGASVEHYLEVQTEPLVSGGYSIRVYRDGDPVLASQQAGVAWAAGPVGLAVPAGSGAAALCTYIEASDGEFRVQTVGPAAH